MEEAKSNLFEYIYNKSKLIKYKDKLLQLREKLNENKKYEEIKKSLDLYGDGKIIFNFFFFENFHKYIFPDLENNNTIFNLKFFREENITNNDLYNITIQWIFYLYMELIDKIYYNISEINIREINQIRYLLEQTFDKIIEIYKSSIIFSTQKVFDFLYFFLFLIENNYDIKYDTNNFDKLYNIKNQILIINLLTFFGNISFIILNKANIYAKKNPDIDYIDEEYKKEINYFFNFLKDLEESKEINYRLNKSIILKNDLLNDLFEKKIFEKLNIDFIQKYEPNYKNKFINFYANFVKFNYIESKILPHIIVNLRNSFMNLYDFNKNKQLINKNILTQGVYMKLIKKLIFFAENESNNKDIHPTQFNSFFFNSYDSQIELNIKNNKFLDNFSIFFSINLSPKGQKSNLYPLFIIENNNKDILLYLYLIYNKDENIYELYLIVNDKNLIIKENKIYIGFTYYINISLTQGKLYLSYYYGKEVYSEDFNINKRLRESENYNLILGKKRNDAFSGYIGPIIIIKILSNLKEGEILHLINTILKLNIYYQYFIYLKKDSSYFFDNLYLYKKNNVLENCKAELSKYNFDCLLYLTPDILTKKNIKKIPNENTKITLPNIDDICLLQKYYEINNLNITLVKQEKTNINFINENGLDYICLVYEYIYQYLRHLEEDGEEDFIDKLTQKNFISIIKKTLFIIYKYNFEIDISNLNKNFKQIFMNFFHCLKLISKYFYIMGDILENFLQITMMYRNSIIEILSKKEKNKENLREINYCFLNGFIDFLLTPKLYDFSDSKLLMILFDKLKSYFYFQEDEEISIIINPHFYDKLLGFSTLLINYIDENDNSENKNDKNDIKINNKHYVINSYFSLIKLFFEKNKSKNDNFINLKNIFNFIQKNFDINYKSCLLFFNFINELIGDNPDYYFSDETDNEQINMLLTYIDKFFLNNESNEENKIKEENEITEDNKINEVNKINDDNSSNKKEIFYKVISIVMKIFFTKKRINKNPLIVKNFINLINTIDINEDFFNIIIEEIKKILENSLGINKIKKVILEEKENNNLNNIDNTTPNYLSNYYSQIFDFILFFFEYQNTFREKIFEVLLSIKGDIEKIYLNEFSIDSIYCLIYLIKFYSNILFKRLYSEKYILEFINICDICISSRLIHTNILIKLENCCKTLLEIVLDTFLHYAVFSTNYFLQKLNDEQKNGVEDNSIIIEQELIYKFLIGLIPKIDKNETKRINTVFYKNDFLNFLAETEEKDKKKHKLEPSYQNIREFPKYKNIYNYLLKEDKFYLSFSIFFIIKIIGYNTLLNNLNLELEQINIEKEQFLKSKNILKLLTETVLIIYEELEILSKNKQYTKSKKKNSSELEIYDEVRKEIEKCFKHTKKKNFSNVETIIMNYLSKNKDLSSIIFNTVNSGKCCGKNFEKKPENNSGHRKSFIPKLFSDKKINIHLNEKIKDVKSSKSLLKDLDIVDVKIEDIPQIKINQTKEKDKNNLKEGESEISSSITEESGSKAEDETSSSGTSEKNNSKKIDIYLTPQPLKPNISLKPNEEKETKEIYYINFLEKPDIYYLRNVKKELMTNIFAIYFSDAFYTNKNFQNLKKIYLGIKGEPNPFTKLLNYPTKLKNFSNGLEPFLFLKPFPSLFNEKSFSITHETFCNYIKNNKKDINLNEIILYKKILPEFNLEKKIDEKCELIKINKNFYGHFILSECAEFFIFEELNYEFHEEEATQDLNDLFTLSVISKQPKSKHILLKLKEIKDKMLFKEKKREKKVLIILLEEIDEIIEKRFLLMWQAIEIYLKSGKSYFFNCLNYKKCEVILNFFKKNPVTKNKVHLKDYITKEKLITKQWVKQRLPTYEYLLYVNKYGSRTFNDPNQYPIFPWLHKLNTDSKRVLRDLKYPMEAQNEKNREIVLNKYTDDEELNIKFPSHFGTHYSTSAYIYFYLMRVEPYTTLLVKLQGYKQEVPDRMFFGFYQILKIFKNGRDNREMIPELYNSIEIYINLNCADFGFKRNDTIVDDFLLEDKTINQNEIIEKNVNKTKPLDFVRFITINKKKLNSKEISNDINLWLDIVFGVEQLPNSDKAKKISYNIFYRESYEKNLNMYNKMKKYIKKKKENQVIIKKIISKINLIVSFGQTPHQIFDEHHPKYGKKNKTKEGDFEYELNYLIWNKEFKYKLDITPEFFFVNSNTGKIFIIDEQRKLEIIESTLYIEKEEGKYQFNKCGHIQLSYFKLFRQEKYNNYFIIKPKYCFSSFEDKIDYDTDNNGNKINDINNYNLYITEYIKRIKYEKLKKEIKKKKKSEEHYIKFINCRHLDNSFKIYYYPISKLNLKKEYKSVSYICEDFVCSCCTIDHNKFVIGLKNGKLLKFSIESEEDIKKGKIVLKLNKQIKAHNGEITMIEINKRLGLIITGGKDNYIYIRKLYDFELLTPIKLKEKYIISSAKISPLNFIYILVFNKNRNNFCFLGYTLNGIYFAKSSYNYYEDIDFTKDGNIVTWMNREKIRVLFGYNLTFREKFKSYKPRDEKKIKEFKKKLEHLNGTSWIKFEYFTNKNNLEVNTKIITYINNENNIISIKTLDVSDFNYFD